MNRIPSTPYETTSSKERKFMGIVNEKDVSFPIQKAYAIEVKGGVEALKYTGNLSTFDWLDPRKKAKTENQAILEFCMNPSNEGFIEALFKEPSSIDFELKMFSYIELEEDNPRVIDSKTLRFGASFKSELLENIEFKTAYSEILRVKVAEEKAAEQREQMRIRQNRESWYHQWKWLEKKRADGEFDEFIENENDEIANQ